MAERVWTKASKFCQSVRDGTHSSPKPSPNGRLLITSKHIVGGRVDTSSAYLISENEFNEINKRSKVDQWDVLITMIGTVGDVCLVIDEPNYAIKNIGLFKTGGELEGRWLFNWLRSEEAKALLHERLAGTTQAYISLGALREFPVPLLPAADMREVNILLGSLDSKIELNRRMNETMEAMAQAIFRDWFVDFGPVRRKMAGATDSVAIMGGLTPDPTRAVELAALFPDALGDDDLPVGWKLEPVTAFAVIKGGKQLEKRHIHSSGPNPVFGGAGVMGYTTLSNAEGYVITVGRVGAYCGQFFGHRGAAWVNNNASLITPLEGVAPEWLLLALRNSDIDLIKRGAAQPFVSNGDVGNLSITAPGPQILEAFGKLVEPLFRMSEARDAEAKTLAETRDYLLPRLMSGEVRVGDAALEIAA